MKTIIERREYLPHLKIYASVKDLKVYWFNTLQWHDLHTELS
jgi:hypothetical protein